MPYLLPTLPLAGNAPDLASKLAALKAFVDEVLSLHDATFTVATYLDPAVDARTVAERTAIMGAPARYAEIARAGFGGADESSASGEPVDVAHRFRVYVYWGVRANDSKEDAQTAFDELLESHADVAPGLAFALRRQGFILWTDPADDYGERWEMQVRVEGADQTFRLIDTTNREYRHEAAITVTITGA